MGQICYRYSTQWGAGDDLCKYYSDRLCLQKGTERRGRGMILDRTTVGKLVFRCVGHMGIAAKEGGESVIREQ